jgi:hypothetical protein
MDVTWSQTPAELHFPPQAAFSWTLRWARTHRADDTETRPRSYRIVGSARSHEELAQAADFARVHDARLDVD